MRLDTAQADEGEQTATTAVEGWREGGSVASPICRETPLLSLMLKEAKPGVGADRAMPFNSITPQQCRISW